MTLEHKADYVEEGLGRLLSQFGDKPRIRALLAAWLQGVQDLEDQVWALRMGMLLDQASGAMLALLGAIVGQSRNGMDDAVYRLWVAARVLVNRSSGQTEQVLAIVRAVVPEEATIAAEEHYPAAFRVRVGAVAVATGSGAALGQMVQLAKVAGVRALTEFSLVPPADTFAFSSSGTAEENSAQGFGLGKLSVVIEQPRVVMPA